MEQEHAGHTGCADQQNVADRQQRKPQQHCPAEALPIAIDGQARLFQQPHQSEARKKEDQRRQQRGERETD